MNLPRDPLRSFEYRSFNHGNGMAVHHHNAPLPGSIPMPINFPKESLDLTDHFGPSFLSMMEEAPPGYFPGETGRVWTSRCLEEEYCIILERSSASTSKSANTRYRCIFCDFQFVGGPQKIRVHLAGKRENGTRLTRCNKVPESVRQLMLSRMRTPKELSSVNGLHEDPDPDQVGLPPRNLEEQHCIVISRSGNPQSKSSNSQYKCKYCRFRFTGGPQKIRVHLTGQAEGGTRSLRCTRVPPEVLAMMRACRPKRLRGKGSMCDDTVTEDASGESSEDLQSCKPSVVERERKKGRYYVCSHIPSAPVTRLPGLSSAVSSAAPMYAPLTIPMSTLSAPLYSIAASANEDFLHLMPSQSYCTSLTGNAPVADATIGPVFQEALMALANPPPVLATLSTAATAAMNSNGMTASQHYPSSVHAPTAAPLSFTNPSRVHPPFPPTAVLS